MQAVRIHSYDGPLQFDDVPTPEPGPGAVRIRVEAASLNPLDVALRAGRMTRYFPLSFPHTLGTDFAGTVEQVGAGVTAWHPGNCVVARCAPPAGGAFAAYSVVPADACVARPDGMAATDGAGLPTAGGTAWVALFTHGGLEAGQTVLVHAGAGGVGSFAVQFARAAGARVVATASGDGVDVVRDLGADHVVDYRSQDFVRAVSDAVGQVDVVLDTVGGDTQARSYDVLRSGGRLVSAVAPPDQAAAEARGVRAVMVSLTRDGVPLQAIVDAMRHHRLRVLVDRALPMAQAEAALARQQSGRARGKVVLTA